MTTGIDRKFYNDHGYLNQHNKVFKTARAMKCPRHSAIPRGHELTFQIMSASIIKD